MGTLLKNLQKSLSNLRFATSSISNNYLLRNKQKLLLKRSQGENAPYFSTLSPQDFSCTKHIQFPHLDQFKVVAGSCNGLVCLDNTWDEFLLWNPSTAESRIISSRRLWGLSDLHPRKQSFSSGFGYDSSSEHFKLVRFFSNFNCQDGDRYFLSSQEIELYDLNSNSWRYIDHPGPAHFVLRNPSIYVDGYKYWLAYFNDTPYILSFNFANEKLCAHDLPNVGKPLSLTGSSSLDSLHFDFVEFKGSIGVIVFPKFGTEKSFELWLSEGDTWVKEYEICASGAQRPLGFWDNGRLLFFEGMNGQLMVCDINTGKMTTKHDIYDSSGKMQLVPYVESDISIKGLLGARKAAPFIMEKSKLSSDP